MVILKQAYLNQYGEEFLNRLGNTDDDIIDNILKVYKAKDYVLFEDGSINLIPIRNTNVISGRYDDLQMIVRFKKNVELSIFSVTTDPSKRYLLNGLDKGTAILAPQQVRGMWRTGYHKGKYFALVQNNKVWVIRDFNKDNVLDFKMPDYDYYKYTRINKNIDRYDYYKDGILVYRMEYGYFGINNHKGGDKRWSIGPYSMGCVATWDSKKGYPAFIEEIKYDESMWGNTFTGTILLGEDIIDVSKEEGHKRHLDTV
jgi:hypothetical protein